MKKKKLSNLKNPPLPKQEEKVKFCHFCKTKAVFFDYMNRDFLIQTCLNEQGKILPRRYTGYCQKHYKRLAGAVKIARLLAILPYQADNLK